MCEVKGEDIATVKVTRMFLAFIDYYFYTKKYFSHELSININLKPVLNIFSRSEVVKSLKEIICKKT